MIFLVFWVLAGIAAGLIAQSKGHDTGTWFVYGFLLPIIALPQAILMKSDAPALSVASGSLMKCPFCAEMIQAEAQVCRYCQHAVEPLARPAILLTLGSRRPDGRILDSECPSCKALVNQNDRSCESCGVVFEDAG